MIRGLQTQRESEGGIHSVEDLGRESTRARSQPDRWDGSSFDPVDLATRLAGGVWGHLVGDAVGVPYEFRSVAAIAADGPVRFGATGTYGVPPGTWSDDGALMLALLDSLLTNGFDLEDQGRTALAWRQRGEYTPDRVVFDIGNTTSQALDAIAAGTPAANAGPTDEYSCGNGSLMRILPIALVERDLLDTALADNAWRASRVTHGHPSAQIACSMYTLIAMRLLAGERDRPAALRYAAEWHRSSRSISARSSDEVDDEAWRAALDHLLAQRDEPHGGHGRVWDSFWSAWNAFAGAATYQQAIERAIAYGNDTDTTAAIAGGLAGIYWGIDGIPAEWRAGMRGPEVVDPLVDRLLATAGWHTSTTNPIRVDWVDLSSVPALRGVAETGGRLGMTFLPGKQRDGWSGLHWRTLSTDVARLREKHGTDTFLLLVEDHELVAARVPDIADAMADAGIELIRFPIPDMDVTRDRDGLRAVLDDVLARLAGGQSVVVACRGGLGRTGTIVACLLRDGGLGGEDAILLTRASRHDTIERGTQVDFVHAWEWPPREARS